MPASADPSAPADAAASHSTAAASAPDHHRGRRRRQRSVRATVAASLLTTAAVLIAGAVLAGGDSAWLIAAAVASVLLGAAASRIVWSEVGSTRREASSAQARQAERHCAESIERSARHTAVVADLGSRLATSGREVAALRRRLRSSRERHALAEREAARLRARLASLEAAPTELEQSREALAEARRVALSHRQQTEALLVEIAVLQDALVERRAVEADELASWQGAEPEGVVRLAAWSDRRLA